MSSTNDFLGLIRELQELRQTIAAAAVLVSGRHIAEPWETNYAAIVNKRLRKDLADLPKPPKPLTRQEAAQATEEARKALLDHLESLMNSKAQAAAEGAQEKPEAPDPDNLNFRGVADWLLGEGNLEE